MQEKAAISIHKLERMEIGEAASNCTDWDVEALMNHLKAQIEELKVVTRLQKVGRFSSRYRE